MKILKGYVYDPKMQVQWAKVIKNPRRAVLDLEGKVIK